MLGAGRQRTEDALDFGAGIVFHKKCGAEVKQGEEIGYVQGTRTETFESAATHILEAITIERTSYTKPKMVLDEWDSSQ